MLDRIAKTAARDGRDDRPEGGGFAALAARARRRVARLFHGIARRSLSSLARRILLLNLGGLLFLLLGFLWLTQTRVSVIDSRMQSLFTQAEIIAAAIAGSATLDIDSITIDPEKLLQQQTREPAAADDITSPVEFSIDPVQVGPVLRRLVVPTRLRARVYDRDTTMLIDTRSFYAPGDVSKLDDPEPAAEEAPLVSRAWSAWKRRFGRAEITLSDEPGRDRPYPEVVRALAGQGASMVRLNASGATIASVAVPIQRARSIRGVLLLSTQEGDIDAVIAEEREGIFVLFGVVTAVMMLLSLLMANTIARPMERLAEGAERVRRSVKSRHQIPDFSARSDEIGHLSRSLRDMTSALYKRLESIESFAADVSHELKNPLTSLRSAVETLPLARTEQSRGRLLEVIQHDVRRLDRLISDISDASRLDAEMARVDVEPVDIARMLGAVVAVSNEIRPEGAAEVTLQIAGLRGRDGYFIMGHDSRLGQVVNNLLDNARSFSPPGGTIAVSLARQGADIRIIVEDDGPGVPDHALERIFERFYTDRPEQGFGQNSGLGLSISRQIVEAHRGRIWAENRQGGDGTVTGARFIVVLPAADHRRDDE